VYIEVETPDAHHPSDDQASPRDARGSTRRCAGSESQMHDHLLVVEPDPAVAQFLALALREEGYVVACAASPAEALALLAARGPAAFRTVLSDDFRAVLSDDFARGTAAPYAWLDRLRTRTDAPIVICTRDPAATYADHQARGYAAVIEEPCDLDALLGVVTALCVRDDTPQPRQPHPVSMEVSV